MVKSRTLRFAGAPRLSMALENEKAARGRPSVFAEWALSANRRSARAGDHHRLAGLDHMGGLGGLAVIGVGAGCDAEGGYRDAGHQRHNHDLHMGTTISRVN